MEKVMTPIFVSLGTMLLSLVLLWIRIRNIDKEIGWLKDKEKESWDKYSSIYRRISRLEDGYPAEERIRTSYPLHIETPKDIVGRHIKMAVREIKTYWLTR